MLERTRALVDPGRLYLWTETGDGAISSLIFTLNLVYQAVVVGLSPFQLVLVGTVLEVAAFVAEVPTGIVADLRSRRLAVVVGYLLIGAGFTLEGAVPAFGAVLAAQVIWGTGAAFTSGAWQAWVVDETSEDRAEGLFLRGAQLALAAGIAGIAGSVALGWTTPRVPVVVGGILWMLVGCALWCLMSEHGFTPLQRVERTAFRQAIRTGRSGLRLVRAVPVLAALALAQLFSGLSSEAVDRLWTPQFLTIGLPTGARAVVWFGVIAVVSMLIGIVAIGLARRHVEGRGDLRAARVMIGLTMLQVVAIGAFAAAGNVAVALAAWWALQLARDVSGPVTAGWLNRHVPAETRATVLSLQAQANAAGQIVGGPLCGWAASAVSLRAGLGLAAAFLAPAVLVLGRYRRGLASSATYVAPAGESSDS